MIGIVGRNASGKSTRLRRLAQRCGGISYLEQNAGCSWDLTVDDLIGIVARNTDVLAGLGISDLKNRRYQSLSGGEKALVMLARALASPGRTLILDEPCAGLDIANKIAIMAYLATLRRRVVIAMHELDLSYQYLSRVVLMKDGGILAAGTKEKVLTPANIRLAFGVGADIIGGQLIIKGA